ncbi:hypothetical protein RJD39_17050 [Vibrio scophthalmi]|uniref:hypothetical protein n=1 Tax=Vibrio TaxID=662 RepID=UPI00021BFDC4|nr:MULTISPECIES: hypothetical protein [Vibrio]EGU32880.1 hypothetical protein VIBRN418_10373 [Vibrio sp. N418]MCY9804618.1 hypothetical protein [Vibrio scophthalmi]
MDLYEVERLLSQQGVNLSNIKILPALVVDNEVVFVGKQGRNQLSFTKDVRNKINEIQQSPNKNRMRVKKL